MLVSNVMRKRVTVAKLDSNISNILPLFFEKKLNSLPVLNTRKQLVGIITREDVLKLFYPDYRVYVQEMISNDQLDAFDRDFSEVLREKTKDVMQKTVLTTLQNTSLMKALAKMIAHNVDQLPVVTEKERLKGIITKSDVFYALYKKNKRRIYRK